MRMLQIVLSAIVVVCVMAAAGCKTAKYEKRGDELILLREKRKAEVRYSLPPLMPEKRKFSNKPAKDIVKEFLADCRKEKDGSLTNFYRVRYQNCDTLLGVLSNWKGPKTRIVKHNSANMLVITDEPEHMKLLAELLEKIDSSAPQVKITVRVVELSNTSELEYGIDYSQDRSRTRPDSFFQGVDASLHPKNYLDAIMAARMRGASDIHGTADTDFQGGIIRLGKFGKHTGNLNITLRLLQEQGDSEILSAPTLFVTSGQTASLFTGQDIPYQVMSVVNSVPNYTTKFKEVGVTLRVTPQLVGDKSTTLLVAPEVSSITGWTDPTLMGGLSNPIISKRNVSTTVNVEDGETLIIGGLRQDRNLLVKRSLPILGDIPFIGYLFSSFRDEVQKTDLIFLLSVEITHPDKPGTAPRLLTPEENNPSPPDAENKETKK